jgi:tetratricopeptide (TPR) repeat protein/polysaccharide pyruvyl transferase WcaK-like protein
MNINKSIRLALEYYQARSLKQAEETCKKIFNKQPNNLTATHLLGVIYAQLGHYDLAIKYLKKAIDLDSNFSEAYHNLGIALCHQSQFDGAVACFQKAIELNPSRADTYNNLGIAFRNKGQLDEAITCYQKTLQLKPDFAEAYCNLGNIFQEKGQLDDAITYHRKALQLNPKAADTYNNLGNALKAKGQFGEAITCYQKALQLNPHFAEAYCNLGNIFQEKGQLDDAITYHRKALQLNPILFYEYNNLGVAFQEKGLLDDAITYHKKALQLNPSFAEAHWDLSHTYLLSGNLKEGWEEYEWRWKTNEFLKHSCLHHPSKFSPPLWDGLSLQGKTLFAFAEQGIGDEVMFASCYPEVIDQGKALIVECDKRLIAIFSRSFPRALFVERVKETDTCAPQFPQADMVIPIGSLPKFLRPNIASFPRRKSYLKADQERVQSWRHRLKELGEGLNIGISWRGGLNPKVIRKRSIMLKQWTKLFSLSGIHFINLQYGDCVNELREAREKLGVTIYDWEDANPLTDIDNFAAQICALDLIISIDNATVHMAGALGKPVWTLLSFVPDWRWMLKFEDTPWYPTMRLFRQNTPGNWDEVFERVSELLRNSIDNGRVLSDHWEASLKYSHMNDIKTDFTGSNMQTKTKKRVALLNDTLHWYHWGCAGTSSALHQTISDLGYDIVSVPINNIYNCKNSPKTSEDFDDPNFFQKFSSANKEIMEIIKNVDFVVVNGEGSIHGLRPNVLNLLYLTYISKVNLGKSVQIINHSCYPESTLTLSRTPAWNIYEKVYRILDFIAIREPVSFDLMTSAEIPVTLSFDCLPLYITKNYDKGIRSKTNKIIVTSSMGRGIDFKMICSYIDYFRNLGYEILMLTGASAFPSLDDKKFIEILSGMCSDNWTLVTAKSIEEWLDIINTAKLLVSGRFHHAIAAAVLGTPFILLESNTPKNIGLARILKTEVPLSFIDRDFLPQLIKRTNFALSENVYDRKDEHASIIDSLCKLAQKNFALLEKMAIEKNG